MLPADEWLPQAKELPLGRSRRVNHVCGGGRTLMVEHKQDGYSAWCYRCSDKGWHPHPTPSLAERINRLNRARSADTSAEASAAPPRPTSFDPRDWPLKARVWLYKAGFSNDLIQKCGLYYTAALDRVVLPVLRGGNVIYWQARGFDRDRPKYLNPRVERPLAWFGARGPVVLTEDYLSAARVGAVATGCAVLGTSLGDRHVLAITARASGPVVIWLDPDPAGRKGTTRMARQFDLAGHPTCVLRTAADPKLYSNAQIEEFIQSALR